MDYKYYDTERQNVMYLRHTTKSFNHIRKHYGIQTELELCLLDNRKTSFRKLISSTGEFKAVSGVHKFIHKLKKLGMKTNII